MTHGISEVQSVFDVKKISSIHLKQCTHSGKITKIILWLELLQI